MFKKARIKLTVFYLLIIMVISLVFSLVVYRGLTLEIARGMRLQALREIPREDHRSFIFGIPIPPEEPENFPENFYHQFYEEAKKRVAAELIFINLGILILSGSAGYFLAGKTLKPIAEMVEEQDRFIADASHELRTPLTAIKTETEVALRNKKLDLKSARNLLISNLEEIDKLQSLTDYFLTLNQYQNDRVKLILETVDLSKIINEVSIKLEPLAKKKNLKINKNLTEISIEANKISLTEVITVLLDNAIKYSLKDNQINININKSGNQAKISVEDFGIGIKASDLPYIFNRFYRADLSRTKNLVKGYGLGLSIAKNIIDRYQGKIIVESLIDKGSVFTVYLPIKQRLEFI